MYILKNNCGFMLVKQLLSYLSSLEFLYGTPQWQYQLESLEHLKRIGNIKYDLIFYIKN